MEHAVLEGDPHSIIEAMAICGYAIGSDQVIFMLELNIHQRLQN